MADQGSGSSQPIQPTTTTESGHRAARITLDDVRRALTLPGFDAVAAQQRMAPTPRPFRRTGLAGQPQLAGVLIVLYPVDSILTFVLMRRAEYEGVHSGQISLPGGKQEGNETFEQTALREAHEEVGVSGPVEILGSLTPLYVPPSDFEIHPVVGSVPRCPVWKPDPAEVAEIIEVPLYDVLDPRLKVTEEWTRYGELFTVPLYRFGNHRVWGATAIILSELEARLRTALNLA
jgi:8-oxo-dGTP pyrophosphatase MutT (NUDIX family)